MNNARNDNPEPRNGTVHSGKSKPAHIKSTSTSLSSQSQKQKKILVIDDNPDIVFTLRVGLESDPTMRVFGFDNPVTALVEFKPNFYDLLLIDVNMPLMDGFQLAQNLVRRDLNVKVCFYDCWRNKYECSKRGASTQEYWMFHQEANCIRTVVKTY